MEAFHLAKKKSLSWQKNNCFFISFHGLQLFKHKRLPFFWIWRTNKKNKQRSENISFRSYPLIITHCLALCNFLIKFHFGVIFSLHFNSHMFLCEMTFTAPQTPVYSWLSDFPVKGLTTPHLSVIFFKTSWVLISGCVIDSHRTCSFPSKYVSRKPLWKFYPSFD